MQLVSAISFSYCDDVTPVSVTIKIIWKREQKRNSQVNVVLFLDAFGNQLAAGHTELTGLIWFSTHQLTLLVLVHPHLVQSVNNTVPSKNLTCHTSSSSSSSSSKKRKIKLLRQLSLYSSFLFYAAIWNRVEKSMRLSQQESFTKVFCFVHNICGMTEREWIVLIRQLGPRTGQLYCLQMREKKQGGEVFLPVLHTG